MGKQQIWGFLVFIGCFFKCSSIIDGQSVANLPNTATVPENADTGTVIFTIQSAVPFVLINQYPAVTSEAFQYDARRKTITIKNGGLLNYDGNHRTFVMRFQLALARRKRGIIPREEEDLLLVIQLEAVKEAGCFTSSGISGCCDGVDTLKWMVPVCTAVELLPLLVCLAFSIICFIKMSNRNAVEAFRQ